MNLSQQERKIQMLNKTCYFRENAEIFIESLSRHVGIVCGTTLLVNVLLGFALTFSLHLPNFQTEMLLDFSDTASNLLLQLSGTVVHGLA